MARRAALIRGLDVAALTQSQARADYEALAVEIAEHDRRYHAEDSPTITDAEYDALRRRFEAIGARFPALADEQQAAASVGARPSEKFAKVRHRVPMLSLANVFSDGEVEEFLDRVRRFLDWPAERPLAVTAEPKIDGLSCSLRYEAGSWWWPRRAATARRARTSPRMSEPSPRCRSD